MRMSIDINKSNGGVIMCGFVGWINRGEDLRNKNEMITVMSNSLSHRGPDESAVFSSPNAMLGHRRLIVVDPDGGRQPMTREVGNKKLTLIYNGELYNTEELRGVLKGKGYHFKAYSDTEVLLVAYMEWGKDCLKYLNGIFAFAVWDEENKSIFLARDPLGVKPLFYVQKGEDLIFASEIKAVLAHPLVDPIVNHEGLLEIFGLGPARSLGSGVFKDIKEIPPGHYLMDDSSGGKLYEYWKLKAFEHREDLETTSEKVRDLLVDAIEKQLVSDVPVCTFLSGGLDSSAISAVAANFYKRKGLGTLNTFSIDYEDNEKYFKENLFQPNSDAEWVKKMSKEIGSQHTNILLNNKELVYSLTDAVLANDNPGMADIDSSLFLFCREVRKRATVALSGECADEIFGGYPWFTQKERMKTDRFPWALDLGVRKEILGKDFQGLPIEEYVQDKLQETLRQVPKLNGESREETTAREMFYLNIKWFMLTLLNRKDRMSMANSLEVRVPFADVRLVEFAFNIPHPMKLLEGREKGLLRKALKGILPNSIIERKKSPYPKTHHPEYTKFVQEKMSKILRDPHSPILQLIDTQKVGEMVETGGRSLKTPWYGQLMTGPQVIAYLIQIDQWMRTYKVRVE
jgi:asparagine synthase (glutamine-hydrolysing)